MKTMEPIHPGEVLHEEFLDPTGISQYRLAKWTRSEVISMTQCTLLPSPDADIERRIIASTIPLTAAWMRLSASGQA